MTTETQDQAPKSPKWLMRSLTIWGAIVAMVPQIAPLAGVTIEPDQVAAADDLARQVMTLANELITAAGALMVVLGRMRAQGPATLMPAKPTGGQAVRSPWPVAAGALLLALGACTSPPKTVQIETSDDGLKVSEQAVIGCTVWEPDAMNGKTCATIEFDDQGGIKSAQVLSGREGTGTEIRRTRYDDEGPGRIEWLYKQEETRAFEGQKFVQDFRTRYVEENADIWKEVAPEIAQRLTESATKIACGIITGGACTAAGEVLGGAAE